MSARADRRLYTHEQAKRDLSESYAFLLARRPAAAEAFLLDAKAAFGLILTHPRIGRPWVSPHASLGGLRVTAVSRRFRNYLIFYRAVADGVVIVKVVHGARDLASLIDSLDVDE